MITLIDITLEEIINEAIKNEKRDFSWKNLTRIGYQNSGSIHKFVDYCKSLPPEKLQKNPFNFRGSNLEGLYGPSLYLPYSNFSNANLSEAILPEADFSGAILPGVKLSGAIVDKDVDEILKERFPNKDQQNWKVIN